VSVGEGDLPVLEHFSFTDYAYKSLKASLEVLPDLLSPLPVESVEYREIWPTLGHIQGTTRMGLSSADSVVDGDLMHHTLRNLVIVGSSTFPDFAAPFFTTSDTRRRLGARGNGHRNSLSWKRRRE